MEFVEVAGIEKFPYKGKVYDLEVEIDHCYTANNYSVHNSAAGGLVNYLIGLTYVDPLKYGLLFERFLDPSREDLPDIDQDIEPRIRDDLIQHMVDTYGAKSVCNIGTYGVLKTRSAILDASRVCGIPAQESFAVTKELPMDLDETKSLEEIETEYPALKAYLDKYTTDKMPLRFFISSIRGAQKSIGTHAAGVLISRNVLEENIPLVRSKKTTVTGWIDGADGRELSGLNYAKMDVLGLKNLEVIHDAVDLIKQRKGIDVDVDTINLDDPRVYKKVVNTGDNLGVFQFESNLGKQLIEKIHPDNMMELSDISSMMRPGPLKMGIPDMYADRKFGKAETNGRVWTEEDIPTCIRPLLGGTKGCIIFQEQVMKIAEAIGGQTRAETNKFRKLLIKYGKFSKGNPEYEKNIGKYHKKFIETASKKEFLGSEQAAEELFALMANFAAYGFNKCIAGDMKIDRDNSYGWSPTIEEMYLTKTDRAWAIANGHKSLHQKYSNKRFGYGKAFSLDYATQKIVYNDIVDITYAGKRPVYKIETESGESIEITDNHKLPTIKNEVISEVDILSGLSVGDEVFVNLRYDDSKYSYNMTSFSKETRPFKSNAGTSASERVGELNQGYIDGSYVEFEKNRDLLLKQADGKCSKCNKQKKRLECHHIDRDRSNNKIENLTILCASCHKKEDYAIGRNRKGTKGFISSIVKIKSISLVGEKNTYNVEMKAPHHTVSVNSIVVKNSHSVSYSKVSAIEYWLKCYYPAEFNVALLNNTDVKKEKKGESVMAQYITSIASKGTKILRPSINYSDRNFALDDDDRIKWGLSAIKGVSSAVVDKIIEERKKSNFADMEDLLNRVGKKYINKRTVEALIWSGAMDDFKTDDIKTRFDLHKYFFTTVREEKNYEDPDDDHSESFLIRKEMELCKFSLTEMRRFIKARNDFEDRSGNTTNLLYEIEDAGTYMCICAVEKKEYKLSKKKTKFVSFSLRDDTAICTGLSYFYPWGAKPDDPNYDDETKKIVPGKLYMFQIVKNETGFKNIKSFREI